MSAILTFEEERFKITNISTKFFLKGESVDKLRVISLRWRGSKRLNFIQGGDFWSLGKRAFPEGE